MGWESFLIGAAAASLAWTVTAVLLLWRFWRFRGGRVEEGKVIERLQATLLKKIGDIPADDLEKIREYIKEINQLEEKVAAAEPPTDGGATGRSVPTPA